MSRPVHGSVVRLIVRISFGLWFAAPVAAHRQALEELRDDVRINRHGDPQEKNSPPPSHDDFDDRSHDDSSWDMGLVAAALTAPFWGPPAGMGDDYSQAGYFVHFPHQSGEGYMLIGPPEPGEMAEPVSAYSWAARGRAEFCTDFDGLHWIGGHVLVESSPRWGLECDFRHTSESRYAVERINRIVPAVPFQLDLRGPNDVILHHPPTVPTVEEIGHTYRDSLWVGDANLLFRFAQSKWLVMRTGLGANFLSDTRGSDFGFNFTYGGDFFPIRPWVISGELDLGTLGANWKIAEAYLGYDYYDIGSTQIAGLVGGVRLWY